MKLNCRKTHGLLARLAWLLLRRAAKAEWALHWICSSRTRRRAERRTSRTKGRRICRAKSALGGVGWIRSIGIVSWCIRSRRIRALVWIPLTGLSQNRDELPLIVLLTVVVNFQRFFTAIGRDSDDAASRDLRTLHTLHTLHTCGLLATLSLLREPKTLLLLAAESRTGGIETSASLKTWLLLVPCCRKPWLLVLPKYLLSVLLGLLHLLLRALQALLLLLLVLLLAELLSVPK